MSKGIGTFSNLEQIINEEINKNNFLLISSKNRNTLQNLLQDLSNNVLLDYNKEHEFAKSIANMKAIMPLEILWNLQKLRLIYLGSYIYFHPEEAKKIPQLLVDLTCLMNEKKCHEQHILIKQMYTDFLVELLISCEGPPIGNVTSSFQTEWTKTSLIIWQSVRRRFLSMLLNEINDININYLKDLRDKNVLTEKVIHKIYMEHLQLIVKHKPFIKVQMAIQHQSSWTKAELDDNVLNIFTEIIEYISDPLEEVITIMKQEEISWKWCLIAISICLHVDPNITKFKNIVDDFLNRAFDKNNSDLLLIAFLLVRQASYENLPGFESYSSWYIRKFGIDANGPTKKDKASFIMLMNFLTNIIPYETTEILKFHLEKSFASPSGCMSLVQEYKTLIRTRLSDLEQEVIILD